MDGKKFLEKWANVSKGYQLCRFVVFVLAVLVAFLLVMLVNESGKEKLILLPPAVYKRVYLTENDASPEYIKEMADYVVYLATNYTPETVDARLSEFLRYVEPGSYRKLKQQVKEIAEDVKFYGRTQAFYPKKFEIDKAHHRVLITGRLIKSYLGKTIEDKTTTFVLDYVIRDGQFMVTGLYPQEGKSNKKSGEKS